MKEQNAGIARARAMYKNKQRIPLNNVIRSSSIWLFVRQKLNITNVISTKSLILFSINTGLDREPRDYELLKNCTGLTLIFF